MNPKVSNEIHQRIIPAIWVVIFTVLLVVLPWPAGLVGLMLIAILAIWEFERIVSRIPQTSLGTIICLITEYVLILFWPFALTYINYRVGRGAFVLVVCIIFTADVAALYGGQAFGKYKLALGISPNKTYEGVICGLFATILVAFVISWLFGVVIASWQLGLLVTTMVLTGVAGDLNESWLKRLARVKDSGRLL